MTSYLINQNSLHLNDKGVWVDPGDREEFAYSDGADEENYLIELLESANDTSLDSAELIQASRDWVSDYHLSAIRANLLKTIRIPAGASVLEVGSGCGAMTRYLGECGFRVDAVEGSAPRAEITALRCRELDNVAVIKHNFNTLELPSRHYDVVLFIGVLEYAKRFIGIPEIAPEQAVIRLLDKAAASLCENGLIIVAIENRTGLKYCKGACEDHLALPDVGLKNYKGYEFTGIKTYDSDQWGEIIEQAGLVHRLFFPFGDYKFPDLVINGNVAPEDAAFLSHRMHSHDPISPWVYPGSESRQWTKALASGTLEDCSNSFGLLIANQQDSLVNRFNSRWALFDRVNLKKQYRINLLESVFNVNNNKGLKQIIDKIPDMALPLSERWLMQIGEHPEMDTLMRLGSELTKTICRCWPQNKLVHFDQLYSYDVESHVHCARYWQTTSTITETQQLFHWLLGFLTAHQKRLSCHDVFHFQTLKEIIRACMDPTKKRSIPIDELIQFENAFRRKTQICPIAAEDDLAFMISGLNKYRFSHVNTQIFWSAHADRFSEAQSSIQRNKQTLTPQLLTFRGIDSNQRFLRIDPCDHEYGQGHYLHIDRISITNDDGNRLLSLQDRALVDALSAAHDLEIVNRSRLICKVSGIDSQIKFSLPEDFSKITHRYNLEFKLQWLGS